MHAKKGHTIPDKETYMNKRYAFIASAFALTLSFTAIHAQTPKNEAQIPVYPGAARDRETESVNSEILGDRDIGETDPSTGLEPLSRVIRVWTVAATPEDVFAFYAGKLGATTGDSFSSDPRSIRAGQSSKPVAIVFPYVPAEDFQDQYGDHNIKMRDGKLMKAKIESRKKTADGQWIQSVDFNWIYRDTDDECTEFQLTVSDNGFENGEKSYSHKSMVELTITRSAIHQKDDFEGMEDEESDADVAERAAFLRKNPPNEKTIGVAVYPGAKFNADLSAQMSSDEAEFYVYESADAGAAIVKFYEQKTGKKAQELDDETYLIALKGPSMMPSHGLVVQPNTMLGGSAKSVITIQITRE